MHLLILWSPSAGFSKAVFWRKGGKKKCMNTRLENTRLDHRPGWAFYSAVFCISYEVKSISGAAENAGKVPGTRALGIKLASVQRHGVVSYHLFCIFIIHQCEEVFVTKKRKKEWNKVPWEVSSHTIPFTPTPEVPMCYQHLTLCYNPGSHFFVKTGMACAASGIYF